MFTFRSLSLWKWNQIIKILWWRDFIHSSLVLTVAFVTFWHFLPWGRTASNTPGHWLLAHILRSKEVTLVNLREKEMLGMSFTFSLFLALTFLKKHVSLIAFGYAMNLKLKFFRTTSISWAYGLILRCGILKPLAYKYVTFF